jgi:AraC-like DNA-binding protein
MIGGEGLGAQLVPRLGPAAADYPPGSTFGPRTAVSFQFVWILAGSASWSCGTATVGLQRGRLLLVRPGMRDTFEWDDVVPTRHAYVHFQLERAAMLEPLDDWPLTRPIDERDNPMGGLCRYLLWLGDARPGGWERRAQDVLNLLVATFVTGPLPGDDDPPLPAPLDALVDYVGERWCEGVARPIPLGELAAAAAVSPSTLARLFRREFGVGPVAALELIRLARAEPLLWMSNLTMSAIAAQCGFADAYHFSRRFRAVYGVPPSVFRVEGANPPRPSPLAEAGLRRLERRLRASHATSLSS